MRTEIKKLNGLETREFLEKIWLYDGFMDYIPEEPSDNQLNHYYELAESMANDRGFSLDNTYLVKWIRDFYEEMRDSIKDDEEIIMGFLPEL